MSRAGNGTFGNDVVGSLDIKASGLENNLPILAAYMFTAPDVDNMKVSGMYCYVKAVSGSIGINMAIYTNSNNAPSALVVAGNGSEYVGDTYGWCWVPPSYTAYLGNGGTYWLVIYSNTTDDYYIKCVADPGNVGFASEHYIGSSFPDPFGSVDNYSKYEPSAYIEYSTPYSTTTNFVTTSVTGSTTVILPLITSYSTTTLPSATYTVGTAQGENPIITKNVSATVSFLESVTFLAGVGTTTTTCSTESNTGTTTLTTTVCSTVCGTGNTTLTTCNTSCSTESMTLYTTSTSTTFVTTATLNVTSISSYVYTTITTSVSTSVGVLGEGWNILILPIIVFFGIAIIVITFGRRR